MDHLLLHHMDMHATGIQVLHPVLISIVVLINNPFALLAKKVNFVIGLMMVMGINIVNLFIQVAMTVEIVHIAHN